MIVLQRANMPCSQLVSRGQTVDALVSRGHSAAVTIAIMDSRSYSYGLLNSSDDCEFLNDNVVSELFTVLDYTNGVRRY